MRLIDVQTLEIRDYTISAIPPYVILSHTWEDEEVTYQEMTSRNSLNSTKKGFSKIRQTCSQAMREGYKWVWVDTCCIDKTSSAELTEAINSMYEWYAKAEKCYVYLSDLEPHVSARDQMAYCRWFTRGWTLQELLAPGSVDFYDRTWHFRGAKHQYLQLLSQRTGIQSKVLRGDKPVADCSIAARMSWASNRTTTRTEDMAYCLLGIFNVSMPMVYGERSKAFRRLQEEIMKQDSDLTILAWDAVNDQTSQWMGLLAPSPAVFAGMSNVTPFVDDFMQFSVTNRGLFISGEFPLRIVEATPYYSSSSIQTYELYLGSNGPQNEDVVGICLRKIGPRLFCRDSTFSLAGFGTNRPRYLRSLQAKKCYILIDSKAPTVASNFVSFRTNAIRVSFGPNWQITEVIPEDLWDTRDMIFLRWEPYLWTSFDTVMMLVVVYTMHQVQLRLLVLYDCRNTPKARLLSLEEHQPELAVMWNPKYRRSGISWSEVETKAPMLSSATRSLRKTIAGRIYEITVSLEPERFRSNLDSVDVLVSKVTMEEVPRRVHHSW